MCNSLYLFINSFSNDFISMTNRNNLEYILKYKKNTNNLYYKDQRIYLLLDLIEKEFIHEKSALFYAKSLNLTTKRLNELTKKYLNKTVSSLIFERIIIEIKRELTYSNLTITEISDNLGFNTISHFLNFLNTMPLVHL